MTDTHAMQEELGSSAQLRSAIEKAISARGERLVELSHAIHAEAEPGFQEHRSVSLIAQLLREEGHSCEVGAFGMPTALRAEAGTGAPRVAILAEYDALPGIGHGCGHNVIAAVAVAAFLGLAGRIGELGGSVTLLGTPAEENGSGKEQLARAGAFDDVDAAMMVHPYSGDDTVRRDMLGCRGVEVTYHGHPAHASAFPEQGRNALDAMVAAYQGIAALRQHMPAGDRIHAIITEGGTAVNVVPGTARGTVMVRSASLESLVDLTARVHSVLEGAALATGTRLEAGWDPVPPYLPMRSNQPLCDRFAVHTARRGRPVAAQADGGTGSTDMGNVSLRVPSIHPMVGIAPAGVALHTAEFAGFAAGEAADRTVIDAAVALASTAADFLTDAALRETVRASFDEAGGAVDVPAALSTAGTADHGGRP